ncbi:uncharacterized protein LOC132714195 [Ruditapes philippinarum]|uniref:uncharacterized protein LOC132714195 n=1 Tax=Ruditapes philippinarum TaxID=129788 RepID=UPI00295BD056|nr:uncharacterized protein LOC132714195 [Ruditapes philippinarum]
MKEMRSATGTKWWAKWETLSGQKGTFSTEDPEKDTQFESENNNEVPPVINEATTAQVQYPEPPAVNTSEISETESVTRRRKKVNDESLCEVCSKEHVGKGKSGKVKKTCNWLNCEVSTCSYWVHALCVGFVYQKESDVKNVKYYCPVHIKKFM